MLRFLFLVIILTLGQLQAEITASQETPLHQENVQDISEPFPIGEKDVRSKPTFYAEFVKMIIFLVVLIVVLMALLWFVKRFLSGSIQKMSQGNSIRIIESRALTPRVSLFIAEVNQKAFLIAESQSGGLSLIELPPNQEKASKDIAQTKGT